MSDFRIAPADSFLIGPLTEYRVVVDGRVIPLLTGYRHADGSVDLYVDRRFSATFPDDTVAENAAFLIAQALAIGCGYSHLGAETKDQPFAPKAARMAMPPSLRVVPAKEPFIADELRQDGEPQPDAHPHREQIQDRGGDDGR